MRFSSFQSAVATLKRMSVPILFAHCSDNQCDCRKPKPGLILRARERFGVDLATSFMVGDRWRDIEAGRRAGCRTILIGDGYGETFPGAPTINLVSLPLAASWILRQSRLDGEIP